jgi:hypothetical protein
MCAAYANSASLDLEVECRVDEFWTDRPDAQAIAKFGLEGHPLLARERSHPIQKPEIDRCQFTAKELLLWKYFYCEQIITWGF